MTVKSDDELVRAAAGGEVECVVALCERYYAPLLAVARAVLGDGHLAEDAAQEALATAFRRLKTLKDPGRFGAWLMTICRNHANDILRRRPRVERIGQRDLPDPAGDNGNGGGGEGDGGVDTDAVRRALNSLPVESRELLYLRFRNELSYDVIAGLLGVSVEAVRGRLHRAKQDVKAHLERERNRDRRSL